MADMSNRTTIGLAKVYKHKRDKFFNFSHFDEYRRKKWMRPQLGRVTEELLLRRREIAGTSVVSILATGSAANFSFTSTHLAISGVFPRRIGKRLARAKHAEVTLPIDLFRMIDPSITMEYLTLTLKRQRRNGTR